MKILTQQGSPVRPRSSRHRAQGILAVENAVGHAVLDDGLRVRAYSVAARATCPGALRARIGLCRSPTRSPFSSTELLQAIGGGAVSKRLLSRPLGRCVGLDVHLEFIEIAICEDGKVFSAGRVPSTPEGITTLAESLLPTDRVALEVTAARGRSPGCSSLMCAGSSSSRPAIPASRKPGRRPIGRTRARWPSYCGTASLRRCGCHRSGPAACAGAFSVASSWSGHALGPRTRSTPW
jgi:hypothetical protein